MRFDRTATASTVARNILLVIAVAGTVAGLAGCGGGGPKKANAMPATDMQKYDQMMKSPNRGMPGGTSMPGGPGGYPGAPAGMGGSYPGAPAGMGGSMPHN